MSSLMGLASEFFQVVLSFKALNPEDRLEYHELRTKVEGMFDEQRKEGTRLGIPGDDMENAQFALAALMDEVVLNSKWEYRREWQANLLQNYYFGTHTAGVDFYRRLEAIGEGNQDLCEIYYTCLSLGFLGKYQSRPEAIGKLKSELLHRTSHLNPIAQEHISPAAYDTNLREEAGPIVSRPSPLWVGIPIVLLLVLYFTYSFLLRRQMESFLASISL